MDNIMSIINKNIINEETEFMDSYESAMFLFSKWLPSSTESDEIPHINLNIDAVGENHAVIRLNPLRLYPQEELTSIFYHQLHQSKNKILDKVSTKSHHIIVYHHNDMDGYVSAATVSNSFSAKPQKFISYNYTNIDPIMKETQDSLATKKEDQKTLAVIVDLSLPWEKDKPGLLSFILSTFDNVLWIDHHGTSLEVANKLIEYKEWNNLSMFIDTRMSSAMQCKCLFKTPSICTKINQIVSYYDRKDDRRYPNFYQLGVYLNQYIYDFNANEPGHYFYTQLLKSDEALSQVLSTGEALYSIKTLKNKIMYDSDIKYKCDYLGLTIVGLNRSGNSMNFTDPLPVDSIKVLFRKLPEGNWLFSVYSDSSRVKKMNLGAIMREEFGGGGHPGAAGATFPIELLETKVEEYDTQIWPDSLDHYLSISGPEPRFNAELKHIFSKFCIVLLNHWEKFRESESSSSK